MSLSRPIDLLRHADWLTRPRVIAWGSVLLAEQLLLLVFLGLWQHGLFVAIAQPTSSDFVSFYAAGKLALAGTPALAYDQAAHHLAQAAATEAGAPYQFFFYPPVFLILCAGLAAMPYPLAFAVFEFVTLMLFVCAMRAVLRETGAAWIAPLLAFPPVFWTLGLGQNAFLTAALFAGFTVLSDRRPVPAGVLLGLLCYKPHFGLLAPMALLGGQRWRIMGAAAATVGTLVALSAGLFGWETWRLRRVGRGLCLGADRLCRDDHLVRRRAPAGVPGGSGIRVAGGDGGADGGADRADLAARLLAAAARGVAAGGDVACGADGAAVRQAAGTGRHGVAAA